MKKLKVYSTPTCPHCVMLKQYLDEKNISYESFDVSVDEEKAQEMIDKTSQRGVPVVVVSDEDSGGEEVIIGFDRERLSKALNE